MHPSGGVHPNETLNRQFALGPFGKPRGTRVHRGCNQQSAICNWSYPRPPMSNLPGPAQPCAA